MLESLDLSGNKFNRSILSSLTALSSLRKLNLMATGFKGTFDVQGETTPASHFIHYTYL